MSVGGQEDNSSFDCIVLIYRRCTGTCFITVLFVPQVLWTFRGLPCSFAYWMTFSSP